MPGQMRLWAADCPHYFANARGSWVCVRCWDDMPLAEGEDPYKVVLAADAVRRRMEERDGQPR